MTVPPTKLIRPLSACFLCLASSMLAAQSSEAFARYTACSLREGPSVVETAPLGPGVSERTVQTLHGPYHMKMTAGRRVMFAYPGEDFYANVKVEQLPAEGYAASRAALIEDFDHTLASGETERNYKRKPTLNGFDIRGMDRSKLEGGVLGIYLLFDDAQRMVTTIYFLRQEPPTHLKTIGDYVILRDRFLNGYTSCIRTGPPPA